MAERQSLAEPDALRHGVMEAVRPGDALVIDGMTRDDSGILGEMLATRLKVLGVAGVVCDGGMRDLAEIRAVGLPMFQRIGAPPSFANLMLTDVNVAVACGGVAVFPGDTVVADEDGVAVCPARFAEDVLPAALEQGRLERYVRRRVEAGEPWSASTRWASAWRRSTRVGGGGGAGGPPTRCRPACVAPPSTAWTPPSATPASGRTEAQEDGASAALRIGRNSGSEGCAGSVPVVRRDSVARAAASAEGQARLTRAAVVRPCRL